MKPMNLTNIIRRSCLLLSFFSFCFIAYGQDGNDILSKEVTISFNGISLEESLAKLETQEGVSTAYNKKEVKDEFITITFEKELLSEVLDAILSKKDLSYKLIGNTVTIFRSKKSEPKTIVPLEKEETIKVDKHTINGYIVDGNSKETLIGANIYIKELDIGATTNEYGFYSITIPEGDYEISFSYIGYETVIQQLDLNRDVVISPALLLGNELNEVVITADEISLRHSEAKMSTVKLSVEKLKSMPMLMGERDLIRLAQLMPGVQSGSEGSTGLYVRGGGPDQNLFLIDGVPIYNINHFFGFLSTLNGDAIKSAEVIKGGFPARYGGRLSSIIDIRTKDGNMEELHGDISIGLISGKFNLEGPLIKDKTSFNISARRTWIDALTTPIQKINNKGKVDSEVLGYNFYDLNAKINHKFSDKSRLFLSSYLGDDHLSYDGKFVNGNEYGDLTWGNRIYSLRWNYQLSPKLFSNTTVYRSAYKKSFADYFEPKAPNGLKESYSSKSDVIDYGAKIDLNFIPNPNNHIKIGLEAIDHKFSPTANTTTRQSGTEAPDVTKTPVKETSAQELSAYIEDNISIGDRFKINVGLHISDFIVENSNYFTWQPRAALSYQMTENSSVKLSYSEMRQFIHLLASPGLGFPNDLWVTSTDIIKPEESTQYAVGYTQSLGNGYEVTVEGYYKTMKNLLEYKSGVSLFTTAEDWENTVLVGNGESYGVEVLLEKRIGKTTGWIGYTLSKSDRTFPGLSLGEAFPYKYDRRHDISVALTHKKSDRMDLGLVWVYGSGNTYTLGSQNYGAIRAGEDRTFSNNFFSTFEQLNHVESRNNQRAPAYHRLDLSVNLHKQKKRGIRTWSFGVYNAYARMNPFTLTVEQRRNSDQLYLKQTSLLSIIPFTSYTFKF